MARSDFLYCNECGERFAAPEYREEKYVHYWLDDKPTEHLFFPVCPCCGSNDFEEFYGDEEGVRE